MFSRWLERRRYRTADDEDRRARFNHVMTMARDISEVDPRGLNNLVRLIALAPQARHLTSATHEPLHDAIDAYWLRAVLGDTHCTANEAGQSVQDLLEERADQPYVIDLARTPVMATPWHRDRLTKSLALIGFGQRNGPWTPDGNHRISLILPYGIGLVVGGNHSLAAGIANRQGVLTTRDTMDLSGLYPHLYYDGVSFVRQHDHQPITSPEDETAGALFEIGRMMIDRGIRCDVKRAGTTGESRATTRAHDAGICYRVIIDGQKSQWPLSGSGAVAALSDAGVAEDSDEAEAILLRGHPFTRQNRNGEREQVIFQHYYRPALKQEIEDISRLA